MTLPNAITLARLMAVPVLVWFSVRGWYGAAFGLFVAAAVSDALDGYLARRLGRISRLGSLLDPLADKVLLVSVFLVLGARGRMELWLVILVVFRDGLILTGWLIRQLLSPAGQPVRPHWTSKINTCAQFLLAGGVLALLAQNRTFPLIEAGLATVVAITTLCSGTVYVIAWMRSMSRYDQEDRTDP